MSMKRRGLAAAMAAAAMLCCVAGAAEQAGNADAALAAYSGIIRLRPGDADAWRRQDVSTACGRKRDQDRAPRCTRAA